MSNTRWTRERRLRWICRKELEGRETRKRHARHKKEAVGINPAASVPSDRPPFRQSALFDLD